MDGAAALDALFQEAVALVDAGDVPGIDRLLAEHPALAGERLTAPGRWLREQVAAALDGFFRAPYLLWFVAEDPVRQGRLPPNIAEVAGAIIAAAARIPGLDLRPQLDHALLLVGWSGVAHRAGVQIALLDVLLDAGASPEGVPNNALVNGHFAAARRLIERGAPLTLASAMCLDLWQEADALAQHADPGHKQFALVLAALHGRAAAVSRLLAMGADPCARCPDLYSHGTPLHHAVWSGSLESVTVLVEAGAVLDAEDTAYHGTPLGWALHAQGAGRAGAYTAIAAYLRERSSSGPPGR